MERHERKTESNKLRVREKEHWLEKELAWVEMVVQ